MVRKLDHYKNRIRAAAMLVLLLAAAPPARAQNIDHSSFSKLLFAHVSDDGMVDYDAFERSPEFPKYLAELRAVDLARYSEADRLAIWINAYNAYTIALVIRHKERGSIRNINRSLGVFKGKGPWSERGAFVGERAYTLDEIEHQIIRKQFREPRIHFALVCAAKGCPRLRREAYTGARLEVQLAEQAHHFLRLSPSKNRVDVVGRTVILSPIFKWYGEDFGTGASDLGHFLAPYFDDPARRLLQSGSFEIAYSGYDWSLNLQRK